MKEVKIEVKRNTNNEYSIYLNGHHTTNFMLSSKWCDCKFYVIKTMRSIVDIWNTNDLDFLKYLTDNYLVKDVEDMTNKEFATYLLMEILPLETYEFTSAIRYAWETVYAPDSDNINFRGWHSAALEDEKLNPAKVREMVKDVIDESALLLDHVLELLEDAEEIFTHWERYKISDVINLAECYTQINETEEKKNRIIKDANMYQHLELIKAIHKNKSRITDLKVVNTREFPDDDYIPPVHRDNEIFNLRSVKINTEVFFVIRNNSGFEDFRRLNNGI